jgi:hypothetical protein
VPPSPDPSPSGQLPSGSPPAAAPDFAPPHAYYPYPGSPGVDPNVYGRPPAGADPGGVYVELRADAPNVRIDRVVNGMQVAVCVAPCRRVLPRNNVYVIDGVGIRTTTQFMLPDDRQQLTLDVKAGSAARRALGVVLLVGGGVVGYVGLVVAASRTNTYDSSTGTYRSRATSGPLAVGAIGAAAVAVGVYLMLTSQTRVQSSSGVTFSRTDDARKKRPAIALTPRGLEF